MLIGGQDDSTGKWASAQVADVADIINPTRDCQSSTIATFPCLSPCNEADWQPQGGWVDGVLIICTSKNTNKCYALSQDGKFHMILQSIADLSCLWWLLPVRFKYKPGYKSCDLL